MALIGLGRIGHEKCGADSRPEYVIIWRGIERSYEHSSNAIQEDVYSSSGLVIPDSGVYMAQCAHGMPLWQVQ